MILDFDDNIDYDALDEATLASLQDIADSLAREFFSELSDAA
jgi:hypothetical protein